MCNWGNFHSLLVVFIAGSAVKAEQPPSKDDTNTMKLRIEGIALCFVKRWLVWSPLLWILSTVICIHTPHVQFDVYHKYFNFLILITVRYLLINSNSLVNLFIWRIIELSCRCGVHIVGNWILKFLSNSQMVINCQICPPTHPLFLAFSNILVSIPVYLLQM